MHSIKRIIERIIGILFGGVKIFCGIALVFMVCVVTSQVIARMFGSNIRWCEEVMLILLCVIMMLLIPVGVKEDLHIRIGVFAKHLPRKLRIAVSVLSNVVIGIVGVCMIYYGNLLMSKTNSKFNVTGMPKKYLYMFTVTSGVLTVIVVAAKFIGLFKTEDSESFINGEKDRLKKNANDERRV